MSIRDRTLDILRQITGHEPEQINDADMLVNDLGADSLDAVEICMELEEEFEIDIRHDEIEAAKSVGDLLAIVARLVGERS